jgi:hypothetical protein
MACAIQPKLAPEKAPKVAALVKLASSSKAMDRAGRRKEGPPEGVVGTQDRRPDPQRIGIARHHADRRAGGADHRLQLGQPGPAIADRTGWPGRKVRRASSSAPVAAGSETKTPSAASTTA